MTAITGTTAATEPRMRAAAQRFEAQALGSLLGFAFGEPSRGPFSGGAAEGQWRPMLVESYAKGWAARGGVGIAASVLQEMLRIQAQASERGAQEAGR